MNDTVRRSAVSLLAFSLSVPIAAQQRAVDLSGMWSDPPATLEDTFCLFFCTQVGLDRLAALLADEANDERPIIPDLFGEAGAFQLDSYIKPRLTPAAVATLGIDPADDPGFLECEPWAFAREIFAPHQIESSSSQIVSRCFMASGPLGARFISTAASRRLVRRPRRWATRWGVTRVMR